MIMPTAAAAMKIMELLSMLHSVPTQGVGVVVVTVSAVVVLSEHGITGSDSGLSHVSSDVFGAGTTTTEQRVSLFFCLSTVKL